MLAEVPLRVASKVQHIDEKVAQVHRRMVAAAALSSKRPPPTRPFKSPRKEKQEALRQATATTTHNTIKVALARAKSHLPPSGGEQDTWGAARGGHAPESLH